MPPGMFKGITIIILVLIAILVFAVVGFHRLGDFMRGLVRNPGEAPFVTACIGFALLTALFIWGFQRNAARQRSWPTVQPRSAKGSSHDLRSALENSTSSAQPESSRRSESA